MSEIVDWRALDRKVVCVAVKRIEGTWCAYIGAVLGEKHWPDEVHQVKDWGSKLSETVALAIFPQFKEERLPYAY